MYVIGLIKEGKVPADNRVALTPSQCEWLQKKLPGVLTVVQPCETRCFKDREYAAAGIEFSDDLSHCDLILGIKEIPVEQLIPGKKYMFFSHTKKKQLHNQKLMMAMVEKKITLIDYECLEHEDGQRILGFGFFAGIVGAHNGMMAYGTRTGKFNLCSVGECGDYKALINTYFELQLPNAKIALTGNGRVSSGILEILNLLDIKEVDPNDYLKREFEYPVFVHLKSADLYRHKTKGTYNREDFHNNPLQYKCTFQPYLAQTDILMNGTYWDKNVPQLFSWEDMLKPDFRIKTIADVSDDANGGVPCNLGDSTIEDPVYGVDPISRQMIDPYQKGGVDVMAVGNLPNELPRDASMYFGDQLIKFVLRDLVKNGSAMIDRATVLADGKLTVRFNYLNDYAGLGVTSKE